MQITFLGHACFELSDGVHTLLVDPYLTGNALAAKTAEEVNPNFIFVTHAHGDHIGDTVSIAKRTGAVVYAVVELADGLLAGQGIKAARGNIGGAGRPHPSAASNICPRPTAAACREAWPAVTSLRSAGKRFTTRATPG